MKLKGNKAFKTFKILLIIILSIILGISLLKYFNLYTEGFSSDDELADIEMIKGESTCDTLESDYAVPACYATVQPHRGTDYLHFDDSDYILKTQIETPVCPNTPFEYGNGGGFGSLIDENNSIVTPGDTWLKKGADISSNTIPISNTLLTTNSTPSIVQSSYTIKDDLAIASAQNNETGLKDLNLNFPLLNPPPEPSKTTTNNHSQPANVRDDTCPPCPACERCPEPVVECKKVVNYSNAANSGKLPVPYINDFSKF